MSIVNVRRPEPVPRLLISVPLEGDADLTLQSISFEDELALRRWLRCSRMLDDIASVLVRLLDDLDACDEERAA